MNLKWNKLNRKDSDSYPKSPGEYFVIIHGELSMVYFDRTYQEWHPVNAEATYDMSQVQLDGDVTHWAEIPEFNKPTD